MTSGAPARITAGDTVSWVASLPAYPASAGWVLKYRLLNAAAKIDIASAASGDDHTVNVTAANSAAWAPGRYVVQAYVEKGADRHTVDSGHIQVDRNLAAESAGYDTRTTAETILDQLMTAYLAASASKSWVAEYTIGDKTMRFSQKSDWIMEINFWKRQVHAERVAQRLAGGLDSGTKVYLRF